MKSTGYSTKASGNSSRPVIRLLRLGRFFWLGGLFNSSGTITAALGTVATRGALAFIATFGGLGSFVSGSFGAASAFFSPLLVSPHFGCGWQFWSWKRSAAFDADFEFGGDVGVKPEFDVVFAKGADRVFEMDFALIKGDVELGLDLIGDHARCDGAEHFAILASLDRNDANEFGKTLGELGHGVELVCLAFSAALFENFNAAFVSTSERNCKSLREEIIAGVTSRDFYLVGLAAQTDNVVRQNDFSFCHMCNKKFVLKGTDNLIEGDSSDNIEI